MRRPATASSRICWTGRPEGSRFIASLSYRILDAEWRTCDPLARTGLALLLADRNGIVVSGQAGADYDWPGPSDSDAPHVVVWDLGLGPRSGLPFLREAADPRGLPILAVVADEDDAQDALAAGARAVLPRNVDGERLAAAVRAVAQGLLTLDESFAPLLLRDAPAPPEELAEPLTPREREVLQLLSQSHLMA
jgi:two-component system NarL family response regulator